MPASSRKAGTMTFLSKDFFLSLELEVNARESEQQDDDALNHDGKKDVG